GTINGRTFMIKPINRLIKIVAEALFKSRASFVFVEVISLRIWDQCLGYSKYFSNKVVIAAVFAEQFLQGIFIANLDIFLPEPDTSHLTIFVNYSLEMR